MMKLMQGFSLWLCRKLHPDYNISLIPVNGSINFTFIKSDYAASVEVKTAGGGSGGT